MGGCVSAQGEGVCSGGGGVSAPGGVCSGGCLLQGVCSGGVCSGGVCSRGGLLLGGVCSRGCLLPQGACSGGGCIPASTEADTPPVNKSQTPVKTLPWPNFVAAGNNVLVIGVHILLPSKVTIFIFTHYFQSSNYSYAYRLET